jgi:DNA-binding GntR family transcriptional regulator
LGSEWEVTLPGSQRVKVGEKGSRRVELPSLEQYVYQLIKEDILSGVLRPGSPLVEARLAEEFGVSKTPVREALIRLRLDGLVRIERFRGARVAEPSTEDVREICTLRRWIEGGIAEKLARSHDEVVLSSLKKNIETCRQALAAGDDPRYLNEIREFDHILARAMGNSWVSRVLSDLYNIFGLIGAVTLEIPRRRERSIDEHVTMLEAIGRGDAQAAVEATHKHITSIEEDYLKAIAAQREAEAEEAEASD